MDKPPSVTPPRQAAGPETAVVDRASAKYVGRWNRLVSTTNWEKGRIISQWRNRLIEAGAPPGSYSDEAWSRRVGGVSPQHAGRLRRVYQRFGQVHKQYRGLYWSHFQAALDWQDAEMWLEGAVQSRWSVAQMRTTRWDAMGAPADKKPKPGDVITAELDEDADLALDELPPPTIRKSKGTVREAGAEETLPARPGQPAGVPPLPDDLAMAFEAFQQAILHHKRSGWRHVTCRRVVAALDALKRLALAPPGRPR